MTDPLARGPVVNIDDVLASDRHTDTNTRRGDFEARFAFIGRALDSRKIGVNLTIVPPRSKAWPRHFHYQNAEMFVILSGEGTLHYGPDDIAIGAMDVINIEPATGIAFQIENTSDAELRYLAFSTNDPTDVFYYPDSDKYGIMALGTPLRDFAAPGGPSKLVKFIGAEMSKGYWEGEVGE